MFVNSPDIYLIPHFGMSPFSNENLSINFSLPKDLSCINFLNSKFGNTNWRFTVNGRKSLEIVLRKYKLNREDVITIITTSNNYYISSCVTNEIEKVCNWNREVIAATKLILVIHEFGYPHPNMQSIESFGIPIIEDSCTAFFSQDINRNVGKYGEYSFYSLPKFFPMQLGGILVSNNNEVLGNYLNSDEELAYITNSLSHYLNDLDSILEKRRFNFEFSLDLFRQLGFEERFNSNSDVFPYSLLLKNNSIIKNLDEFKQYLTSNGVQNSTFYGEDAFFIPMHQGLSTKEINFIYGLIEHYIQVQNK